VDGKPMDRASLAALKTKITNAGHV
jgi:hypothetical protein